MISSYGVREGIIFDSLDPAERQEDPLDAGLDALIADEQASEFGRALADWASEAAPYTLNARLSAAACRLVDIGALLHPDHRADLAFDLVARAPLPESDFMRAVGSAPTKSVCRPSAEKTQAKPLVTMPRMPELRTTLIATIMPTR